MIEETLVLLWNSMTQKFYTWHTGVELILGAALNRTISWSLLTHRVLHLAPERGTNACSSTNSDQNHDTTSEACESTSVRSGSTESLSESQLQAVVEIVAQTMRRIVTSSPNVVGSDSERHDTDGRVSRQPQYNTPDSQQSDARSSPGIRSDREVAQILAMSARISEQVAAAVFRDSPLVVSAARIPIFANNRIFSAAPNRVRACNGTTTDGVTTSRPICSSVSSSHAPPTEVIPASPPPLQ